MYPDRELIAQINAGNLHAFRILVNSYERLVFSMVQKVVKDADDQKDVCQEVFIKVYKNIRLFKQQSKLSTWIAQIAYTTSLDYLKKEKKRTGRIVAADEYEDRIPAGNDPGILLDKKELRNFVARMIDELPADYRLVIQLFHIEEYSYQEIVGITGLAEGTIKSHLYRARKLLKDKLAMLVK